MHPAIEAFEVIGGVGAFPVDRELVPGRRRCGAEPGALVADIGPHSRGLGAPVTPSRRMRAFACRAAGSLHLDPGVIGEDGLTGAHMTGDGVGKRFQQRSRTSDPIGKCRTIKIDAFALVDAGLAIEMR